VDEAKMEIFEADLKNPKGEWKRYIGPKEYLYQTFDKPMGRPLYQNEAMNDLYLAGRRIGKTEGYKTPAKHKMVFNNAYDFQSFRAKTTSANIILTSYEDDKTKDVWTKIAKSHEMLRKLASWKYTEETKDGTVDKVIPGPLFHPFIGGDDLNDVKTNKVKVAGFSKRKVGAGTQIKRTSVFASVAKAIGGEPDWLHGEELGAWKVSAQTFHELADPATKKGGEKFGTIVYSLTGGEIKYSKQVIPLFKNPKMIGAVEYPDVYTRSNSPICKFTPAQFQWEVLRDKFGNIDYEKAWNKEYLLRSEAYDLGPKKYTLHISQFPMVYTDSFMQESSGILPVERASQRLTMLQSDEIRDRYNSAGSQKVHVGQIDFLDKEKRIVAFRKTHDTPITDAQMKNTLHRDDHKGAVVIYEAPAPDEKTKYIAAYDSIEHATGTSLCVVCVFKFFKGADGRVDFNIVAEHVYRHYGNNYRDKNDLQALKLALLYDCQLGPETNKPNILTYAEKNNYYDVLADCPMDIIRTIVPGAAKKYPVGAYISPGMIDGCAGLAAEVSMTEVDREPKMDKKGEHQLLDSQGKKLWDSIWMVDKIDSEYLLNDFIFWKKGGNYDYMSAFFVICLYVKQYIFDGTMIKDDFDSNSLHSDFNKMLDSVSYGSQEEDQNHFEY
jgi:hypothetical protein